MDWNIRNIPLQMRVTYTQVCWKENQKIPQVELKKIHQIETPSVLSSIAYPWTLWYRRNQVIRNIFCSSRRVGACLDWRKRTACNLQYAAWAYTCYTVSASHLPFSYDTQHRSQEPNQNKRSVGLISQAFHLNLVLSLCFEMVWSYNMQLFEYMWFSCWHIWTS